jgi:simple sugar transport system permease protein
MKGLPVWADVVLVPLLSLLLAMIISALVILGIGADPVEAMKTMLVGAVGSSYAWGYTLYYATSFIFTGLAVTVAFHAGQFNIGGEGQAQLGGLGVAVVCLALPWPHWTLALPAAMIGAALFGAAWAAIPAYLQARRGSHIVITTIMFNYIAASLIVYLLVDIFKPPGSMDPATARFPEGAALPQLHEIPFLKDLFLKYTPAGEIRLNAAGLPIYEQVPANVTLLLALLACYLVWLLLWRSRLGFEIRAFGKSQAAAVYAGISPFKIFMLSMLISGGLAGLMATNNVMGDSERLVLNSSEGAGFIGIAVALMGRNHPIGVLLAAILFGILYQGGAEIGLWTSIPIELRTVVQALVILFVGGLDTAMRMLVRWGFRAVGRAV